MNPEQYNPLAFLLPLSAESGLTLVVWPQGEVLVSALLLALFASFFWSVFLLWLAPRRPILPRFSYSILIGYAVGMTLAYSVSGHFFDKVFHWLPAYFTALIAGAGLGTILVIPAAEFLHTAERGSPVGAPILVGVPTLLAIPLFLLNSPVVGLFLIGSALLGFWTALWLITLGVYSFFSISSKTAAVVAALTIMPLHTVFTLVAAL